MFRCIGFQSNKQNLQTASVAPVTGPISMTKLIFSTLIQNKFSSPASCPIIQKPQGPGSSSAAMDLGEQQWGIFGRTFSPAVVMLGTLLYPGVGAAQVIPDATLQFESSVVDVTTNGSSATYTITSGAARGSNLFHSFKQFSVPAGNIATFANADTIDNIIVRVTGGNVSTLEGGIQARGRANLFLLNPAGIVVGPNAQLDIGGSFLGSTGQGLRFDNGFVYGTAAAETPPLLTISAPIGLVVGNAPGPIGITGLGDAAPSGLSVPEGQTLALVGSNVSLTGARLTAPAGRLEIGSVNAAGDLSLAPDPSGFDVGFAGVNSFGDIQIADQSILDASGRAGGAIQLQGREVALAGQSALISDTLGDLDGRGIQIIADSFRLLDGSFAGTATLGTGASGDIDITAAEDIEILGTSSLNYKLVEFNVFLGTRQITNRQIGGIVATTNAPGQTGDISLNAQRILLDAGVLVSTESFGPGNSGDIAMTATASLHLRWSGILAGSRVSGIPLLTPDGIATGLSTSGIPAGGGGNIEVNTPRLMVENGSVIASGTLSDQASGNVSINAPESVTLKGSFAPFLFPTSITTISIGGRGAAGDVQIETGRLSLQDGSLIFADSGARSIVGNITFGGPAGNVTINATDSIDIAGGQPVAKVLVTSNIRARTFSDAPAGTIQITTPNLTLRDGGLISSATQNSGAGGAINIDAQNIVISGIGNGNFDTFSGIIASSGVETQIAFLTGEMESVPASGTGGNIILNTTHLAVQDTARISVGSFGSGVAGNLEITAEAIRLGNRGTLTATTTSDGGGNVTLTANTLTLDNGSITASSDRGNGGNLSFNLQDVLLLRNGSLISTEAGTAAAGGNGGDITLNLPNGLIVAVPVENSDIRANAFAGNGGNVGVTARSLLGIAFRPGLLDTPLSDITASSRFGRSGTVTINELFSNFSADVVDLPTETAPPTLAQGCRARGSQTGSFVISGRGGLPTNPADLLSADTIWQDLAPLPQLEDGNHSEQSDMITPFPRSAVTPLVEAQSWTRTEDGKVIFLAESTARADHFIPIDDCKIY
jgi:filamentous hemagglutinin family protein